MRGNRSELAPGRKSLWCHVNTPLVLHFPARDSQFASCSSCSANSVLDHATLKHVVNVVEQEQRWVLFCPTSYNLLSNVSLEGAEFAFSSFNKLQYRLPFAELQKLND